jgi:hypothetical protein
MPSQLSRSPPAWRRTPTLALLTILLAADPAVAEPPISLLAPGATLLSAPGGGEGRGEVGECRLRGCGVAHLTLPVPTDQVRGLKAHARRVPSLSPRKRAERAKLRDS